MAALVKRNQPGVNKPHTTNSTIAKIGTNMVHKGSFIFVSPRRSVHSPQSSVHRPKPSPRFKVQSPRSKAQRLGHGGDCAARSNGSWLPDSALWNRSLQHGASYESVN